MAKDDNQCIFFVDDEPKVREVVGETLEQLGVRIACFAGAADCLERLASQSCDLLITDMKMPDIDGMELLRRVKRIMPWIPVLVITGYGDIPTAVAAIRAGAADFIEKPLEKKSFLEKVESLLKEDSFDSSLIDTHLTKSEQKVLRMIIDGKSNKEIAIALHRSIRTIEVHRSRIMKKLNADNLVDLIKQAAKMGLFRLPEDQNKIQTDGDEKHLKDD